MKTLKILVKGIVQRVGYRAFIERVARRLKIKGTVKNLADSEESVEIIIQHKDKSVIEEFLKSINIKTELVHVEQIIKQEIEQPEFLKFEVLRGSYEEENAERLDVAAAHLDNLTKEVRTGFTGVNNKLESMDSKLENIDEKLEMGFSEMNHGFSESHKRLDKINVTLEKSVVSEIAEMKEKIAKIEQVLHIKS
ncbi:MAG: acylphosphatase [Candidatus Micrarchaeota archaeon]